MAGVKILEIQALACMDCNHLSAGQLSINFYFISDNNLYLPQVGTVRTRRTDSLVHMPIIGSAP